MAVCVATMNEDEVEIGKKERKKKSALGSAISFSYFLLAHSP